MLSLFQGVTYCGESKASTLTMENVPWHEEVLHFFVHHSKRIIFKCERKIYLEYNLLWI